LNIAQLAFPGSTGWIPEVYHQELSGNFQRYPEADFEVEMREQEVVEILVQSFLKLIKEGGNEINNHGETDDSRIPVWY